MKLIERSQLAGMNIHYRYFSFEYFLESQMQAGFQTIELWAGSPHFFLSDMEYADCVRIRHMLRDRGLTVKVITPDRPLTRFADFTAGRDSHPAPKNLFFLM